MNENWKTRTLLIGAAVGIVSGLIGAYILIQAADKVKKLKFLLNETSVLDPS